MPRKKKNKYQEIYNRYCLAGVIILGVFIISYLGFTFINDTNEKRYQQSYLVKSKLVKDSYNIEGNLSNIKNLSGDYYLYISYTGSESIYKMEKDLKKLIKEYKLQDKFYYINIDSIKSSDNKISLVNELLGLDDIKVEKVPTIIYVNKDNKVLRNNIKTQEKIFKDANITNLDTSKEEYLYIFSSLRKIKLINRKEIFFL